MRSWLLRYWRALLAVIVVIGLAALGLVYVYWDQFVPIAAMGINYVKYWSAPAGTLETEAAQTAAAGQPAAPVAPPSSAAPPTGSEAEWPSYNKTLASDRFSPLSQINSANAGKLKVLCTYDTGVFTGFNSGILEVNGALIFVTEYDMFSIDPSTCRENWRAH
jgi:alcohol dehydrogenase (cytochrome c)